MKKKIEVGLITLVIVVALGIFSYLILNPKNIPLNPQSPNSKGSISQKDIQTFCDGVNNVCILNEGEVIAKKPTEVEPVKNVSDCEGDKCNLVYASNTRVAVEAIRKFTGIPNLNLTPLVKDGLPIYITYYCSNEGRCWAIDHETHSVVNVKN